MAKRSTAIGRSQNATSRKTKKRLAAKKVMLAAKMALGKRKTRKK